MTVKLLTFADAVDRIPQRAAEHAAEFVAAEDLVAQVQAKGFTFGLPPWLNQHSAHVDRVSCACSACPVCGNRNLISRPYHKAAGRRYKLIAICRVCNHGEQR